MDKLGESTINARKSVKTIASSIYKNETFLTSSEFFVKLCASLPEIRVSYAEKVRGIIDKESVEHFLKNEPDETEILMLVDKQDEPYKDNDNVYTAEFRGNWYDESYILDDAISEQVYCRAAMFILEDENGNIIVPERAKGKWGAWLLSIAWGHVTNGDNHLETCLREAAEELSYNPDISKKTPVLVGKFRRNAPWNQIDSRKAWQILSVYVLATRNIEDVKFDTKEIASMSVFTKKQLFEKLTSNITWFIPFHAYSYLNYLEMMLDENLNPEEKSKINELKKLLEVGKNFGQVVKI